MATFILTVVGDDRPGLVSAISTPITLHGGSWERGQMSRLAGKFAGIVLVSVPTASLDALTTELEALSALGLRVVVERTGEPAELASQLFHLELLGGDHPGIVAEISASLAALDVSIEELSTDVLDAPMAGGTLFEARAVLRAPQSTSAETLRSMLEGLANELMVEIQLSSD